jgi:putative hydrolase of HD superfamily
MEDEDTIKFFSEVGYLKRMKHNGLIRAGVKDPDTIAEHSFRAALIGYVLADLEGADPEKVAVMCLIHDLAETRIGDQNKVNSRYLDTKKAEKVAFDEQMENVSAKVAKKWQKYMAEMGSRNTKEGIAAKDADWLETALTAKEYLEIGYKGAEVWIENVEKALETDSAKKILNQVKNVDFINYWWQGLLKMTYKKLGE